MRLKSICPCDKYKLLLNINSNVQNYPIMDQVISGKGKILNEGRFSAHDLQGIFRIELLIFYPCHGSVYWGKATPFRLVGDMPTFSVSIFSKIPEQGLKFW